MKTALVFGGSGQIGRPLLERLGRDGWRVFALSRGVHNDSPGLHWLRGDFARFDEPLPRAVDVIASCGPLDLFAQWYAASRIDCPRVLAFGSTSAEVKQDSGDPVERDLAQRLQRGEARVFESARDRGAAATLLRPTLVYGAGRDATLSRIAALARRWNRMVLPRRANGLRQPVHVDDLALAVVQALPRAASAGKAYALPGGEALPYREMVLRVLACLEPPPRLVEVPAPVFAALLKAAQSRGLATGLGAAAVARMRSDLVFDAAPAQADFGYAPRPFRPTADMFGAR